MRHVGGFQVHTRHEDRNNRGVAEVPLDLYNKVLDAVFPLETDIHRGIASVVSVRVMPSFTREYQITVTSRVGMPGTVEYVYVDKNVHQELRARPPAINSSIQSLAKFVSTHRLTREFPRTEIHRWDDQMLESVGSGFSVLRQRAKQLSSDGAIDVVLDGNAYQIVYLQGSANLKLQVTDSDLTLEGRRELGQQIIRWAEGIIKVVLEASAP